MIIQREFWKDLKQYTHDEVLKFYKLANFCLVTSPDDGMNLVAKEFIAARNDEKEVLVLSEFNGVSSELSNALVINLYNGQDTAKVIKLAIEMDEAGQQRRMKTMRDEIKTDNIFLWSAKIIKKLISLDI